jgi:hypothetical protein
MVMRAVVFVGHGFSLWVLNCPPQQANQFAERTHILSFRGALRAEESLISWNSLRTENRLRTQTPMNPYWIVVGFSSCLQMFFFLRWLHRRTRDDEIRRAFVRDMAVIHLPHLYHALRQIAGHLGIQLEEQPPVQFLELNGNDRKP